MLDLAVEMDIIDKRGSWYSYGDVRLGQGRENSKEYLRQNEELGQEIEKAVREQSQVRGPATPWTDVDEDGYEDDVDGGSLDEGEE